jgi:uncharacterized protein YecE (DUF72 family)
MQLYAGTSGYSYAGWKGHFYPSDLPTAQMLRYYAGRLLAVEINNTFYRLPKPSVIESWAGQVPRNFRFSIKASQKITHIKRLKDTSEETSYLINAIKPLGEKFGVLFFQLPPFLQKDLPRLQGFLSALPNNVKVAFEFRHATWFDDEVFDCLKRYNCALCIADTDEELEVPFVRTAGWGYLRLRRAHYTKQMLARWFKVISSQEWAEAFVFFKHEEKGIAATLATAFQKMSAGENGTKLFLPGHAEGK